MFYYFKWCHGFLDALALLVMAAGVVVGAVRGKQFYGGGIDRFWNRGQRMERFQKILFQSGHVSICIHDLRKDLDRTENVRQRITMEEFDGFLIKMQTLDKVITDFTPPVFDRWMLEYPKKFHHTPVDAAMREHKLHVTDV